MTEKVEKLQASLEKSEAKVAKIENTISKHFTQLEKKANVALIKHLNLDFSGIKYGVRNAEFAKQIEKFEQIKMSFAGSMETDAQYWAMCDVVGKLEDINGSYKKLAEAQQVVSNWEAKIAKEVAVAEQSKQAPQVIKDFLDKWEEMVVAWFMHTEKNPNEESIRKFVAHEKQIKMVLLTSRVEKYVGTITDAKGLQISEKGDLVGVIVGDQGSAHVQSIMAGGWNIQCFHFRTIVNPL